METMNIGGPFISWVKLLLKSGRMSLLLNGWMQPAFEPTRGVKQGDPLSPLLFLLSLEPMCNLLRQHSQDGLQIGSRCVTGAYFADDSTLFSKSVSGLRHQLELVRTYCVASGAKLNYSKCVTLVLNRQAQLPELPDIRVLPDGESVKYLGVLFGRHDLSTEIIENIDQRLFASLVQLLNLPATTQVKQGNFRANKFNIEDGPRYGCDTCCQLIDGCFQLKSE